MRDINDRSIRDIPVVHRRPARETAEPRVRHRRPRRRFFWWIAFAVIAAAAILGLLISTVFAGASLTVVPKEAEVVFPATVPAYVDGLNALTYQTFSVNQSATTTAPTNGTEQVMRQASGKITILNKTAEQRLIANTRFQSPEGKIYRIRESVTVPAGTDTKPGSATAIVYADSPGPDYNRSGSTTYTIPGFKGDPRYGKITATSGAITGGFSGTQPKVSAEDLSKAKATLQTQLDQAVRSTLMTQIPAGYQVVEGSVSVVYGDPVQGQGSGNTAAVSQSATATGALIRTDDLASTIARMTIGDYKGEAITFAKPGDVSVSATSTAQSGTLVLSIAGTSKLVWLFDPNALKQALLGQPKSKFEEIISQFEPSIIRADATIRPFWTRSFPKNPDEIAIKIKLL